MGQERPNQAGTSVDHDILAGLLLQLGHFADNVVADQMRVVPIQLRQRRRDDVLRNAVEPIRETVGVLPPGPGGREPFVGHAPQEERVRRERFVSLEFLDLVVPEWEGPLLQRLNDPVQRDEERGCKTATRMGRHDRITSLADQNREDSISLQRETGRRKASAWRDAMHAGGVPALTPAACPTVFQTRIETLIYPASSRWSQQWFDGQSGGDTPGPIPNPEVKPAHVPCGSAVREPARSLPSFEEGLGRRPRHASRPSLWWTTNRAVLTAVGPWNAVSHSLYSFERRFARTFSPRMMTGTTATNIMSESSGIETVTEDVLPISGYPPTVV